jgi:hypothetical protein
MGPGVMEEVVASGEEEVVLHRLLVVALVVHGVVSVMLCDASKGWLTSTGNGSA